MKIHFKFLTLSDNWIFRPKTSKAEPRDHYQKFTKLADMLTSQKLFIRTQIRLKIPRTQQMKPKSILIK